MKLSVITNSGITITADQLQTEISLFGKQLSSRSLVFCLCNNEVGSLIGYLGCLENKIVPILLDASKDADSLSNILQKYKPNYIWAPLSHNLIIGKRNIYSTHQYGLFEFSDESIEMNNNLALLLTTSGSTGSPKLVRLSYENIWSNANAIADYLQIDENERPITSLPMYYSYGLSVINSHLIKGATILLTSQSAIQKEFWTFAKEHKATSIAGVPYTYEILKRLRVFRMDLPFLRTMTQAGGKLNALIAKEYMEQAEATGKRFIVMYGQTEATARMSYLPWEKALDKYNSIGIAIPGGKFSLINEKGDEIAVPDIDGELVYTGDNVSMGYAESYEDLKKGDNNHGVLYTGDIARKDEDGYYYITGRMKRFVKIYGNRVNLDATEQLVKAITISCACVGVDDKLTVFITDKGKKDEIRSLLVKKTGLNIRAFDVRVIDSIPKNSSGKVQYAALLDLLNS